MWPAPQPTNDNSLTDLQDRKRAPLKHSRCCLENHTGTVSSTSILISSIITGAEINSQYMKERKPLMDKRNRFIFAVHEEDTRRVNFN